MKKLLLLIAALTFAVGSVSAQYSKELEKKAKSGDESAMIAVGDAFLTGNGTAKDAKKAKDWYQKAIKAGSDSAYIRMADLYTTWNALGVDPHEERSWFIKAYNKSMPLASLEYARRLVRGDKGFENLAPKPSPDNISSAKQFYLKNGGEDFARVMMDEYPHIADDRMAYVKNILPRYEVGMDELNAEAIEEGAPILLAELKIGLALDYIHKYEEKYGVITPEMEKIDKLASILRKKRASDIDPYNIGNRLIAMSKARKDLSALPKGHTIQDEANYFKKINDGKMLTLAKLAGVEDGAQNENFECMFVYAASCIADGRLGLAKGWISRLRAAGGYEPLPALMTVALYRYMGDNDSAIIFMDDMIRDNPENIIPFVTGRGNLGFMSKGWFKRFEEQDEKDKCFTLSVERVSSMQKMVKMFKETGIASLAEIRGWVADAKKLATGTTREELTRLQEQLR